MLLRDPAQVKRHKEFGKPPLQPAAVEAVRGRHADCRRLVDKVLVRGVHFENLVALPEEIDNWEGAERLPLELDSAAEPSGAASLGQMIDAAAQGRPTRGLPLELEARPAARARLRGLEKGRHVVYAGEARRRCRVGRVIEVASAEGRLTVHRYGAAVGGRLTVQWVPLYVGDDGLPVRVAGARPLLQEIGTAAVLAVVDLHSGVLGHAAAARLARAGWRVEDAAVADDGSLDVGVLAAASSPPASRCPTTVVRTPASWTPMQHPIRLFPV